MFTEGRLPVSSRLSQAQLGESTLWAEPAMDGGRLHSAELLFVELSPVSPTRFGQGEQDIRIFTALSSDIEYERLPF